MTQHMPPGWYPDPAGSPGTRFWDGYQWAPAPPAPPKKTNKLLIVGIVASVVFLGFLALGVMYTMLSKKSQTSPVLTPGALPSISVPSFSMPSFPSPAPSATAAAPVRLGQPATDGQTVFTVTSIDRSKTAGDPANPFMTVTAQGEFLNVHLTVRNNGTESQSFAAFNQKLLIGGNTYDADSTAALWTKAMNVAINPGNTIQAVISFDVPTSTADVSSAVRLRESLLSPGVEVDLS